MLHPLDDNSNMPITVDTDQQPQHPRIREYKRWFRVSFYTTLLAGQCTSTILGEVIHWKSGKSKWVVAFVQSVGFPVPLPLIFYSPTHTKLTKSDSFETKPKLSIVFSIGGSSIKWTWDYFLWSICNIEFVLGRRWIWFNSWWLLISRDFVIVILLRICVG